MGIDLERSLLESNFGKVEYNVKFDKIICKKRFFTKSCNSFSNTEADTEEIKLYGTAISSAENMKDFTWVLTEENILVRDYIDEEKTTLNVNILIDENVNVLNSTNYVNKKNYSVQIFGLHFHVWDRRDMWCIFK